MRGSPPSWRYSLGRWGACQRSWTRTVASGALFLLRALIVLAFAQAVGATGGVVGTDERPLTNDEVARLLAEVPNVMEVALSPDGGIVAYAVDRSSIDNNNHTVELFLQKLDALGGPQGNSVRIGTASDGLTGIQWWPDSRSIGYFATVSEPAPLQGPGGSPAQAAQASRSHLVRYDVESKLLSPVLIRDGRVLTALTDENGVSVERRRITAISRNYRLSPSGNFVAFAARLSGSPPLNPRAGTVQPDNLTIGAGPRTGLFVVDVRTGDVEQVSPDTFNVVSAAEWSPDEKALVVAGAQRTGVWNENNSDLYIVERSGTVRPLVVQPGIDWSGSWSPDGKFIAFASSFGDPDGFTETLGVVPSAGGEVVRVARGDDAPSMRTPAVWSTDGLSLYYQSAHHMSSVLVRANIRARTATPTPSVAECAQERSASFSADRRRVAFIRSSLTEPPEVYVRTLPAGEAKRVSSLAPPLPFASLVKADRVDWPSRDGKFTIHGMLLTPRAAWHAGEARVKAPLPTVVYNGGGPSMVSCGFAGDGYNGGTVALAVRGYAVLMPNSRGREGFGAKLAAAMRDDQSYLKAPHSDVMAGIDMLERRGIADPNRLGISGHSYGANLTAYSITATSRFKAAAVHEATRIDLASTWMHPPGSPGETMARRHFGVRDPYDPEFVNRVIEESAIFHMGKATTPTLLQFGQAGAARDAGFKLFAALRQARLPTEFVIYDSGHGVSAPAAKVDELSRLGAWFDYWLKDEPYPDTVRGRTYDEWRSSQRHRSSARVGNGAGAGR